MAEASILVLIGGLTECVKIAGLPSKFLPIASALIGGAVGYAIIGQDQNGIALGIIAGLVTTGIVNKFNYYMEK